MIIECRVFQEMSIEEEEEEVEEEIDDMMLSDDDSAFTTEWELTVARKKVREFTLVLIVMAGRSKGNYDF